MRCSWDSNIFPFGSTLNKEDDTFANPVALGSKAKARTISPFQSSWTHLKCQHAVILNENISDLHNNMRFDASGHLFFC